MNEDPFRIGEGGPPSGSREGRHGDEQVDPALRGEFRTLGLDAFLYVRGGHKRARCCGPERRALEGVLPQDGHLLAIRCVWLPSSRHIPRGDGWRKEPEGRGIIDKNNRFQVRVQPWLVNSVMPFQRVSD